MILVKCLACEQIFSSRSRTRAVFCSDLSILQIDFQQLTMRALMRLKPFYAIYLVTFVKINWDFGGSLFGL